MITVFFCKGFRRGYRERISLGPVDVAEHFDRVAAFLEGPHRAGYLLGWRFASESLDCEPHEAGRWAPGETPAEGTLEKAPAGGFTTRAAGGGVD